MFRGDAPAVGLGNVGAIGNAKQRVVRPEHIGVGEERLVRCHQQHVVAIGEIDQARLDQLLHRHSMPLQLDIEPITEALSQILQRLRRRLPLTVGEQPTDRAGGAAGESNQALASLKDVGERELRAERRVAVEIRLAGELEQVPVAGLALGQHHQLIGRQVLAVDPARGTARKVRRTAGWPIGSQ